MNSDDTNEPAVQPSHTELHSEMPLSTPQTKTHKWPFQLKKCRCSCRNSNLSVTDFVSILSTIDFLVVFLWKAFNYGPPFMVSFSMRIRLFFRITLMRTSERHFGIFRDGKKRCTIYWPLALNFFLFLLLLSLLFNVPYYLFKNLASGLTHPCRNYRASVFR